ncbi:MAG TPA: YdeI/OmpD-associated family protein [Acidothermaceae bacterium]|jgi:uncharacterized protein YdeI (YjbR/CyaY-like superfamily)
MALDLPSLAVTNAGAWRNWLDANHARSLGVWLLLAKQGTTDPTRLTYDQALEEALSYGWIDGQIRRGDDNTYSRRFTPRSARSRWSKRNISIIERLMNEGRMHPAGLAEVERARADGRWGSAYAGSNTIDVPADFAAALAADPRAQATFETLTRQNRYSVLYRIDTAKRSDTRARRIQQFVEMLARGETIHPQGRTPTQ